MFFYCRELRNYCREIRSNSLENFCVLSWDNFSMARLFCLTPSFISRRVLFHAEDSFTQRILISRRGAEEKEETEEKGKTEEKELSSQISHRFSKPTLFLKKTLFSQRILSVPQKNSCPSKNFLCSSKTLSASAWNKNPLCEIRILYVK